MSEGTILDAETRRIRAEYERRGLEIDGDLYAPWQPGEMFMVSERERLAASILRRVGKFPVAGDRCLELGYGRLGWLARMISWGLRETDLYGVELDAERAAIAHHALPSANLTIGNGTTLAFGDGKFRMVVVSTVFSSVLDHDFRALIALEIDRVLTPGGVVLWYDAAVNNPRNNQIGGIGRSKIKNLFPNYGLNVRSVTLAPPISRAVAKFSWTSATFLSNLPFLRTHLLGVLIKP
jgi:hypothetical protein